MKQVRIYEEECQKCYGFDYTFDGEERPFKFKDVSVGDDLSEY